MIPDEETFEAKVRRITTEIADLLIEKNKCYGNSALQPLGCFYKGNATDAIKVRIDDKLSRIMRGKEYQQEDTIKDLIGYLVLYKIAVEKEKEI